MMHVDYKVYMVNSTLFLQVSIISDNGYLTETQDARLAGTLLVDVEAKADVEVFCFIFGGDNESEANITFTVSNNSVIMSSIQKCCRRMSIV